MTNVTSLGSFDDCVDCLDGRESRVLRNNVRLVRDGADITVVHHTTAIVRYSPNGMFVMDCDGYRSATTKANLNRYTKLDVYQRRGEWFVSGAGNDEMDYHDGMGFFGKPGRDWIANREGAAELFA